MTPYELEVRKRDGDDGLAVVELAGELDLTNAADVERDLERSTGHGDRLILDLSGVSFVDSAALHMLFRVARRTGDSPRLGVVLVPDAPIARTLSIVGLDAVATLRPTLDELLETS